MASQIQKVQRIAIPSAQFRTFSDAVQAPQAEQAAGGDSGLAELSQRVGADLTFSEKKHAYVLTFPWNFPEVIEEYEADYKPMSESAYWSLFMNNTRSVVDFNNLYREFHQGCAIPCQNTLNKVCEPRLASHVGDNLRTIHFHGLDVEMANLTVESSIRVLKAEVSENLVVDRSSDLPLDQYDVGAGHWG